MRRAQSNFVTAICPRDSRRSFTGSTRVTGTSRRPIEFLIADEPTGNLDPQLSAEIMGLFEAFNQVGVTVLVATHDLPLISRMRHRIITLKAGLLAGTVVN